MWLATIRFLANVDSHVELGMQRIEIGERRFAGAKQLRNDDAGPERIIVRLCMLCPKFPPSNPPQTKMNATLPVTRAKAAWFQTATALVKKSVGSVSGMKD
jgi:hypothetical protein